MRAHTITIMSRRRRRARRRAIALVLAVCSLAIPASAGAYSSPNAITGGTEQSSQPSGGSDHSSVNAITGGSSPSSAASAALQSDDPVGPNAITGSNDVAPGYTSLNATTGAEQPRVVSGSPPSADEGFDWASFAVGAGAALALAALGAAAFLTLRRPPSPAETG